jgi:MFS family permease
VVREALPEGCLGQSGPRVTPPPSDPAEAADGRRPGWRWVVVAGLAGVAASTLATALAAAVAGRQSDLALQPVELALRVGLLLGAPCVGAILAAVVVPRGGGRLAVVAIGVGVPVGPLLVLRLDRVREFGLVSSLLTVGVMVAWGVVGAALAAGWWARPGRLVQRSDLPLPVAPAHRLPDAADTLEASGDPGPRGPAA